MDRTLLALAAVIGVPAATCGYIILAEQLLGVLPVRRQRAVRPWIWLAPALLFLVAFLVYPALQTVRLSLYDARSVSYVGLTNYAYLASDAKFQLTLRNNLIWLVLFTAATVVLGLTVAVLTNRRRYESVAKAAIFLPMAISFVGAGIIWKFIYDFRPPGAPQTGLLNAILAALVPGFQPQAWLILSPWNNLALIVVGVWVWTGFCAVILSAALKGLSQEVLEAARVDGASAFQGFWYITIPLIAPTIAVVTTTMIIFALKAFDIVYVMTSGNFATDVLANRMYTEMFNAKHFGRSAAIAVVLLLAVIPIMLGNIQRFRQQEDTR